MTERSLTQISWRAWFLGFGFGVVLTIASGYAFHACQVIHRYVSINIVVH